MEIIENVVKLLPLTLCWWHFLFSTEKGSRDIISETLIFTILINSNYNYSIIVATLPDPTVLPPSLTMIRYLMHFIVYFTLFILHIMFHISHHLYHYQDEGCQCVANIFKHIT